MSGPALDDGFARRLQTLAKRRGHASEIPLQALVFCTSFRRFDANRRISERCQIVGTRSHIEHPDARGELKAVRHEVGWWKGASLKAHL